MTTVFVKKSGEINPMLTDLVRKDQRVSIVEPYFRPPVHDLGPLPAPVPLSAAAPAPRRRRHHLSLRGGEP